jgi:outer membrane beta-barrel protein
LNARSTVLIALLIPGAAFAQQGLGLDLTDETKKEEPKKDRQPQQSAPAAPPIKTGDRNLSTGPAQPVLGERDTTAEDRVKSIQRKVYLKKHRFELAPYVSTALNDPYYSKLAVALRGAFYLSDTIAVSARFTLLNVVPTSDERTAKSIFQSRIFFSNPLWSAMGDFEWSPVYGKVSFLNSILHFDAYLLTGLGAVKTETSNIAGRGLNPAGDIGIGLRFVAKDFLAVNVAVIDTFFIDQPRGTTQSVVQNLLMLNVGLSIFLPLRSTGREAE